MSSMLFAWALLALLGLAAPCSFVVPRSEWEALPSECSKTLQQPVRYVVISHTAGSICTSPASCEQQARNVQHYHMSSLGWCDVAYNFLIGEDGHVYEGRGWSIKGDHTGPTWNPLSIGITFMGNYMDRLPPRRALRAAQNLLECGVSQGFLRSNYEVKGHRDVQKTLSPGNQLYDLIRGWAHYRE
ncbi:peptidoglycan recognition protein 1 [Psammomys obesus]|uniref:peptidoglycan recognition protein 1 n=1 Tax=Psammomys obesus TaxID=48139 RepID=UPI002452FDD8|nr:peptidoglycan recognition protein 1 [Psammomys obesus]